MSWTSLYEIAPLRTLLKKYVDFRRRPITFPCSKETGLHSPFLLTRLVHFYVAIWHNLSSRSIATRCRKSRCGSGYERLSGRSAKNWASRSSPAFCRARTCPYVGGNPAASSRQRLHAARQGTLITSAAEGVPDASAPGDGISGRAAPFSTTSGNITDDVIHQYLPAAAGRYSVTTSKSGRRTAARSQANAANLAHARREQLHQKDDRRAKQRDLNKAIDGHGISFSKTLGTGQGNDEINHDDRGYDRAKQVVECHGSASHKLAQALR
jgi:hypothetical protein